MTIQLYDEEGYTVGLPVDEETIWAEYQLSEEEEDTIEHLAVGETAKLNYGWKAERIS